MMFSKKSDLDQNLKYSSYFSEILSVETKYKSISLSRLALEKGGILPIFLNAANEVAVNAFLNNKIQFLDIVKIIDKVIEDIGHCDNKTLETISDIDGIFSADNEARRKALESIELGF